MVVCSAHGHTFCKVIHYFQKSKSQRPYLCSARVGRFRHRTAVVRAEADPVGEENFFKGSGCVGFIGGGGSLFPGIPGFGISDPESEEMVIPVDEFVNLSGFGGGIKAAELEFLDCLHIFQIDYYIL